MKPIPSLEALGLTRLEGMAYAYLVAHPAATGYKVSKGIGKPTANVYRALEGLERKGAVRSSRGTPPLFRAVPPDELLDQLQQDFMDRREIASMALRALEPLEDNGDDGVFALATAEQVVGRIRVMLSAARHMAMVDMPEALATPLEDAIADARARRVRVVLLAHAPQPAHRDTFLLPAQSTPALRAVIDGCEMLMASLTSDAAGVHHAIGSRNPLLAQALHDTLAMDAFYSVVAGGLRDGLSVDEIESTFDRCRQMREAVR